MLVYLGLMQLKEVYSALYYLYYLSTIIIPEYSKASLYADDTKTFRQISSKEDTQHLQPTLTKHLER